MAESMTVYYINKIQIQIKYVLSLQCANYYLKELFMCIKDNNNQW